MTYCVVDLETTGLDPKHDAIIEIGAVRLNDDGVLDKFECLVDPGRELTPWISELTGITDDMLVGKPKLEDVFGDFLAFCGDCVPVAHNAAFESSFLRGWTGWEGSRWLDTLLLARIAFPYLGSYTLESLVSELHLANRAPHRAAADAEATALLLLHIQQQFQQAEPPLLPDLAAIFGEKYSVYHDFFTSLDTSGGTPDYQPLSVASTRQKEPAEEVNEEYSLDKKIILELLQKNGGVSRYLEDFQPRDAQLNMAGGVTDAFNRGEFLLAEAGTGTGKSLAYLIPAALLAMKSGQRVLVSTHTIHLQDQLLHKDIPLVDQALGGGLRAVLVKGRNHYLCLRKWENVFAAEEKEAPFLLARLLPWVLTTKDGDVDVISLTGSERRDWTRLNASGESCLRSHCPYYRSKCFVHRVREQAEHAHIIVVNHSLLLTDATLEGGILPTSGYLVVDEAHQLDKVAEETIGGSLSFYDHATVCGEIRRLLGRLEKQVALTVLMTDAGAGQRQDYDNLQELLQDFDNIMAGGEELFKALKNAFEEYKNAQNVTGYTWRIDGFQRNSQYWTGCRTLLDNYFLLLSDLDHKYNRCLSAFEPVLLEPSNERDRFQSQILRSRLTEMVNTAFRFLYAESEATVAWLETGNERMLYPLLKTAPLDVGELLAERLYTEKKSVIFVSATLSVSNKFSYFKHNCGLDLIARDCRELLLPSPFDYEHHCLLAAANDLPLVTSAGELRYTESISNAIQKLTLASHGRALALFTSHVQLREVYRRVRRPLAKAGITVLAQDLSGSRTTLLEAIRTEKSTLILGANSFWEGIDVAGDSLSLLIIVKLPFAPPDMPILAARSERLEQQGKSAFAELGLPQAVIRFKQGFGRLLRKEEDRGIVCVLDRRIYEKRYGTQFLRSLPVKKLHKLTVDELASFIKRRL